MQLKMNTTLYYVSMCHGEEGTHSSMPFSNVIQAKIHDMLVFTEEQEAIDAAKRILALHEGTKALESLTTEELVEIVPRIDAANIEDTMDHLAHRCD